MRVFEKSSVPFQLAGKPQPLILLPATVNGHGPFPFILDTGAGFNLITARLAVAAGIEPSEVRRGTGAGGAVSLGIGAARTLSVGDIAIRDSRIGITDELVRVGAAIDAHVEGAVGYEFLRGFCLTLDYRRRIATFSSSSESDADREQKTSSIRLARPAKPLILVDAFVNESGPFQFVLDTGASTTTLSHSVASTLALRTLPMAAVVGGGGTIEAEAACVRSLRVADRTAENFDVVVTNATELVSRAIGEPVDGILGYNFLCNFEVVIDYPRASVTLS